MLAYHHLGTGGPLRTEAMRKTNFIVAGMVMRMKWDFFPLLLLLIRTCGWYLHWSLCRPSCLCVWMLLDSCGLKETDQRAPMPVCLGAEMGHDTLGLCRVWPAPGSEGTHPRAISPWPEPAHTWQHAQALPLPDISELHLCAILLFFFSSTSSLDWPGVTLSLAWVIFLFPF